MTTSELYDAYYSGNEFIYAAMLQRVTESIILRTDQRNGNQWAYDSHYGDQRIS